MSEKDKPVLVHGFLYLNGPTHPKSDSGPDAYIKGSAIVAVLPMQDGCMVEYASGPYSQSFECVHNASDVLESIAESYKQARASR